MPTPGDLDKLRIGLRTDEGSYSDGRRNEKEARRENGKEIVPRTRPRPRTRHRLAIFARPPRRRVDEALDRRVELRRDLRHGLYRVIPLYGRLTVWS